MNEYFVSPNKKTIQENSMLSRDLKHWYGNDDKDFINDCLDVYDNKRMMIKLYTSIHQLSDGGFALWTVLFHPTKNQPQESSAQTLTFNNDSKTEMSKIQVWISKFFGSYFKEKRLLKFTEDDFNGKDVKLALDYQFEYDDENENNTMLVIGHNNHPIEIIKKTILQFIV